MPGKTVKFSFFLLFLILVGMPFSSSALESAGRLINAEGTVMHSKDGGNTWEPARVMSDFPEGTYIRVGEKGQAAILLPDHSQIRLQAGSILRLKKAGSAPGAADQKKGVLNFIKGKLWFRNKRRGPKPLFETPTVTIAIRGTEIALAVEDQGDTDVTVLEGALKCDNEYGEAVITRGQAVTVKEGEAPEIVTLLVPEDSVQWLLLTPAIRGPADLVVPDMKSRKGVNEAEEAMALFTAGKREAALKKAMHALEMAPTRSAPHVALATILQSMGRFEDALEPAVKGAALDPSSIPATVRAVELLMGLDRTEAAKELLGKFPDHGDARILLLEGYLALSEVDTGKAEEAFRKSILMRQDLSPSYLGLGLTLFRMGKTEEALVNMEKASLLDPLAAYPHYYLAKALYELGEREEAQVELRRASILDPLDPTPHLYLSIMLTDGYRPGEGILELQKALFLNDNRLATRGRYLLDQDRAARNVSLAYSLSFMGLNQWAKSRGDRAVWDDPSSSGAYLFRAQQSVALNSIDPSTLGDITRARLLQPVNQNTFGTYSDYQSLLEIPDTEGTLTVDGGSDSTLRGTLSVSGGKERLAFYAEGDYASNNGPFDGTGIDTAKMLARAKGILRPGHELFLDFNFNDTGEEDRNPWQDGFLTPLDRDINTLFYAGSIGYHYRQGAGKDLLLLLQGRKRKRDDSLKSSFRGFFAGRQIDILQQFTTDLTRDTFRLEATELFRTGDHRLTFGGTLLGTSAETKRERTFTTDEPGLTIASPGTLESDDETFEARIHAGDIWFISPCVSIDYGLSFSRLTDLWEDSSGKKEDNDEVLPHLGMVWRIGKRDMVRLAWFGEVQPDVQSGALQASEVAGFEKVTGSPYGTRTDFFGLGWDRQWNRKIFTRFELFYQQREYPFLFSPHPLVSGWRDEDITGASFSFERLITESLALSLDFNLRDVRAGEPVKKRRDFDAGCRLTWVHPQGWRCQAALWYLDQDEKRGYVDQIDDDFVIGSFSVEKSFMDKRGLIFARVENIFGEKFGYLTVDAVETRQLPWQDTLMSIGFQWNF